MKEIGNFIDTVASITLIHECIELTDTLYSKTAVKCCNLFIPHADAMNNDIIAREMKDTQDYIYSFIKSCEYQLQKDTIKELKKYCRDTKYKTTQTLYDTLKEV